MTARGGWVRVGGQWRRATNLYVRVGGLWKSATEAYVRVGGQWLQWWPRDGVDPPDPGQCPTPGVYLLNPTAQSIGASTTAWAEFDLTDFTQGTDCATNVRVLLNWNNATSYQFTIAGRPSGGSIVRDKLPEYQGRSIYHNVAQATIDAINSGQAIGVTLTKPAGVGWDVELSGNIRLEVTVGPAAA